MSLTYDCSDAEERRDGLLASLGAVQRGELIVLPTDTVYGIGADAFSPPAVDALLTAKGRGRDMPPPVLVGSWAGLEGLVLGVEPQVRELIEAFWPGGLTVIVEHAPSLAWDLGNTRGTVAVRMPAHPVALDLLAQTGPMAVSSANRAGEPPAANVGEALEQLGDSVSVYLDGGPSGEPVASTIVDLTGPEPILRRAGAIPVEELTDILPDLVVPGQETTPADTPPADNGADSTGA